jgi:Tfp pilus assembly protein PilO
VNSIFDKLNLRPNERRLVIGVAIVVFIILNWIFVWPEFGEWGRLQKRQREADDLLRRYRAEVQNTAQYQKTLNELEKAGATVASEEQALKLSTTIYNQAALSGVTPNNYNEIRQTSSGPGKGNQFFEEKAANVNITGDEKALVDFLYNLGVGGSLIRVRSMSLSPDQPRYKLQGNLQVVASYARKAPPKAAPAATPPKTNAPAAAGANTRSTTATPKPISPFTNTNAPGKTNLPTKK